MQLGLSPFNPAKIQLENYPRSFANVQSESPVKATCSSCRLKNVELNPLVKQGVIPKNIAHVFTYTPPLTKTKTKSKIVKNTRIVTSEEVKSEVEEIEKRKNDKLMVKIQPKKRKLCAKEDLKTLVQDNYDNFSSDDGEDNLNDNNDCYNDDVTDDCHDSDNISSISDSDNDDDDYSSDDDFENGKIKQIKLLWDTLSPPTSEAELQGKWYAVVYRGGKKNIIYVGKVLKRFLGDEDGPVTGVEFRCLKPKFRSGTILESNPKNLGNDDFVCPIEDIIAGSLDVEPLKGSSKYDVHGYSNVVNFFNSVKDDNRKNWLN